MKNSIKNKIEEINSMIDSINEESTTKEYINSINNMSQGNFLNNLENAKRKLKNAY